MKIRDLLSIIIMLISIAFGLWLAIGVMLVGGIMQAITGFQIGDVAMAAWGIARALLCELGFVPMWIGIMIGVFVSD